MIWRRFFLRLFNYGNKNMSDQKFNINEFGEIHRPNHTKKDDLESSEYSILQYEIFSHPERFTTTELEQKKKRLAELEQKFGKQDDSALTKMRIKLKQKKQHNNQSLTNALLGFKQNRESGK